MSTTNYVMPKDPNMLYSYINMMLRDGYSSLEEFCKVNDADIPGFQFGVPEELEDPVFRYKAALVKR